MANDIIIIPSSASIQFSASAASNIALRVEASGSLNFVGKSGSLFSIEDTLSGSLMSVSDVSGLPIFEVFSDNGVHIGRFNAEAIDVKPGGIDLSLGSGSVMFITSSRRVGIGTNSPANALDVVGNISASAVTASTFFGTASYATTAASGGTTLVTASTYPITSSWALALSGSNPTSSYALYALFAFSSSWASTAGLTAFAESSDFSLDSNYAYSASYADTCSVTFLVTESVFSASYFESSSWASQSLSSSISETASFALNAGGAGVDILAVQVFM